MNDLKQERDYLEALVRCKEKNESWSLANQVHKKRIFGKDFRQVRRQTSMESSNQVQTFRTEKTNNNKTTSNLIRNEERNNINIVIYCTSNSNNNNFASFFFSSLHTTSSHNLALSFI